MTRRKASKTGYYGENAPNNANAQPRLPTRRSEPVVPSRTYYDEDDSLVHVKKQSVYLRDSFSAGELNQLVDEGDVSDTGLALPVPRLSRETLTRLGTKLRAGVAGVAGVNVVGAVEDVLRTNSQLKYGEKVDRIVSEGVSRVKESAAKNKKKVRRSAKESGAVVVARPVGGERVTSALEHSSWYTNE